MPRVEIGSSVRDILTGFEGVVLGRTEYITGCVHLGVQPRVLTKDGRMPDWEWIDEKRVEVLETDAVRLVSDDTSTARPKGGPMPNAPSCC